MLNGIFPVIPSLFNDRNEIDPMAVRRVVAFAIDAGAHGVVFPGVASEYNYLSRSERCELTAAVVAEVAGRLPVIGGASAQTTEDSIDAGRELRDLGIRHLMILAPARFEQDVAAHRKFFANVSSQLNDIEIILQNAPQPIGAGLDANAISDIVKSSPAITYTKEETLPSGPVISSLLQQSIQHLKGVLGGGGARYIIDELDRGASGALPAVELTDLHVSIYNAHKAGNVEQARVLYRDSLPLLVAQLVYRMRLTKFVLQQRGIADSLHVRAPLPELDARAKMDITRMLRDLESVIS